MLQDTGVTRFQLIAHFVEASVKFFQQFFLARNTFVIRRG